MGKEQMDHCKNEALKMVKQIINFADAANVYVQMCACPFIFYLAGIQLSIKAQADYKIKRCASGKYILNDQMYK